MVNKSLKQPPPASTAKASETQKNFVLILLKLFLREIYCLIGIQQTFTNKADIEKKIIVRICQRQVFLWDLRRIRKFIRLQ